MRRLVDRWWLVGSGLLAAVIALTCVLYVTQSGRHRDEQRATQRQAVSVLSDSVNDVLAREAALARVVGSLGGAIDGRWPALSDIVMSQPLANSTGFIEPVSEAGRAAYERRTGLRLVESPGPGALRVAGPRPLHMVLNAYRQVGPDPPPLGLDIASNPLRRELMLRAARSGLQLATPPVVFLGRQTHGVVVYVAVRDQRGRPTGWVSAAYEARQLASMVTAQLRGVQLTIHDGPNTLVSAGGASGDPAGVIAVAGRRWSVWAAVPGSGISAVPWLVLSLGLVLTASVILILRQASDRARRSTRKLALRDAEEAAIGQIATLVAHGASPAAVFQSVAEQIVNLFDSRTGAVSRFDAATNQGIVLGGWTSDGKEIAGAVYALDGASASAEVFRTGGPARIDTAGESRADPTADPMGGLGERGGVAAPIIVAGSLWGALGAAYGEHLIPTGVEVRLERFASLVALAISNADAWDRLARQAASDPLTGIANRRVFHERLSAEVARAQRYRRNLSLTLIDLDHFKAVNDLHGHQAGDRVLVLFAQLLAAHAREGELVARIGGEEFAWLMPEADEQGALAAADRVRKAIKSTAFEGVGSVTLSAGVCSAADIQDPDTLFHRADRALYWAKDCGRDRTLPYTDQTPDTRSINDSSDHLNTAFSSPGPVTAGQRGHATDTPRGSGGDRTASVDSLARGR